MITMDVDCPRASMLQIDVNAYSDFVISACKKNKYIINVLHGMVY